MSMLLAIDIGNTNIGLGVFRGTNLVASWRLASQRERTADELGILIGELLVHDRIDRTAIDGIVVASVVPPLTTTMNEMARRYFGRTPLTLESGLQTGMPVRYDTPADVGADRVVNAVAAFEAYGRPRGRPVIVVDFGTATTFDAISAEGEYLGGVICPGVQISADALFERAARLPRVDVRKPPHVIGRTTVTSMQSGLFFGYIGLVEGIVERMRRELGADAVCIATGGLAEVIAPETRFIEAVDRELTLNGLRIVWERNQEQSAQNL
jgi:type III pantothenate kinase